MAFLPTGPDPGTRFGPHVDIQPLGESARHGGVTQTCEAGEQAETVAAACWCSAGQHVDLVGRLPHTGWVCHGNER